MVLIVETCRLVVTEGSAASFLRPAVVAEGSAALFFRPAVVAEGSAEGASLYGLTLCSCFCHRLVVLPVNLQKDASVGPMIKVFMRIDGTAYQIDGVLIRAAYPIPFVLVNPAILIQVQSTFPCILESSNEKFPVVMKQLIDVFRLGFCGNPL